MSENRLWRLADELSAELHEFLKLKAEVYSAQRRFMDHEPDIFELRALGSILHDVYQNVESICSRIVKTVEQFIAFLRLMSGSDEYN